MRWKEKLNEHLVSIIWIDYRNPGRNTSLTKVIKWMNNISLLNFIRCLCFQYFDSYVFALFQWRWRNSTQWHSSLTRIDWNIFSLDFSVVRLTGTWTFCISFNFRFFYIMPQAFFIFFHQNPFATVLKETSFNGTCRAIISYTVNGGE